jgi:hypothetical protein
VKLNLYCLAGFLLLPAPQARAQLSAGAAKVDITPDTAAMQVPLGGYAARKGAPATGIHDRIYARALVLSEANIKIGIVSVDLCFLPANFRAEIGKRVAAAGVAGLDLGHLLIAATHSHTSPDPLAMHSTNTSTMKGWTSYAPALAQFEADKIAQAIVLADHRVMPAKIGVGTLDATGSNRNRRGEKITDPTMTLVRITDEQGRSLAAIVDFAAHPTLYDDKMMEISADWPGAMCGWLETTMGGDAVAMFLNGAEGDASPNGAIGDTASAKVENYGRGLGEKAWDILRLMQLKSTVTVTAWREPVDLPPRKPNALFIIAARSFGATMAQAQEIVRQLMPTTTTIGFFRVGDLLLICFPCEPTGELGLAAKQAASKAGYAVPAVVALADDWLAYALTPGQYREGNYEAGMSFYGDQLGPVLLRAVDQGLAAGKQ